MTITGGTLAGSGGGVVETTSGTSTLSCVTIDDGSILKTDAGTFLDFEGTTTVNGTVTFEGGGTFVLDPGVAAIVGGSGGGTLDIAIGATLTGSGDIGHAGTTSLTLNNSGIVDATGCLTVNLSSNILTNDGTMEATCGGELSLLSPVLNYGVIAAYAGSAVILGIEVSNEETGQVSGEVIASGHCAVVDLLNVYIIGGTVESDKGGLIQTVTGEEAHLRSAPSKTSPSAATATSRSRTRRR